MSVMLKMNPGEDRKAETKQQRRTMTHQLVDPTVRMSRVVASIVNHRAFEMQRKKACAQQQWQRPTTFKPSPDGDQRKGIAAKKQSNSWIPNSRRIDKFTGNRTDRSCLLNGCGAL